MGRHCVYHVMYILKAHIYPAQSDSYNSHFTYGQTKSQRGYLTCPRSHSYRKASVCLRLTHLKKDCGNRKGCDLQGAWKAQIMSPSSIQERRGP